MITLIIFIAVLAVLVLSHEFGHFIIARKNGIKVEEFGFGFPPRIVGIRRIKLKDGAVKWHIVWGNKNVQEEVKWSEHEPGTVYSINWLPLGGFVKIKGEDSTGAEAKDEDSFSIKKPWQKASVLVAGVAMNVIVAAVLLSIGFMVGLPSIGGGTGDLQDHKIQVMQVFPGKPAEAAGITAGDFIVSVGTVDNPRLKELQDYVNLHKDETIPVTIERQGQREIKNIKPTVYAETGKGGLGVAILEVGVQKYPWYQAIYKGILATGDGLKQIVIAFFYLIKGLVVGGGISGEVAGPVGVAVLTGQAARLGFVYLIQLMALLSLNLAVLNILPIPALDGGRLLFVIISKIKGKQVSPRAEQIAHTVGFALLMLLVFAVTLKDLGPLFGNLVNWVKNI